MTFAARSLGAGTVATGPLVTAPSANVTNVASGTATSAYRLTSTGNAQTKEGAGAYVTFAQWIVPASGMALYECRMTVDSTSGGGSLTGSGTGTWLALSADRTWTLSTSGGADYRYMTLEIRLIAVPGVILATGSVNLTGETIS